MAAPVLSPTAWQWPADVLAFAAEQRVDPYLGPLLEATHRLFPTRQGLRVEVKDDPELRDVRAIVFEVRVPQRDIANFFEGGHPWTDELFRCCPPPLVCVFGLSLIPVPT